MSLQKHFVRRASNDTFPLARSEMPVLFSDIEFNGGESKAKAILGKLEKNPSSMRRIKKKEKCSFLQRIGQKMCGSQGPGNSLARSIQI